LSSVRWLVVVILVLRTPVAAAGSCPRGKALFDLAKTAFQTIPIKQRELECRELHAAKPLVLITFQVDRAIVIGAVMSGDKLLWIADHDEDCTPCTTVEAFTITDLDGDGVDELLVATHKTGHMMTSVDWLDVFTLDHDGLPTPTTQPSLLLDDSSLHDYTCSSTLRVIAGAGKTHELELLGACKGDHPEFRKGRHVYALHGNVVEETK